MIGLKTLQRYVLREVLVPTAMSMAVLTFLLLASAIFSRAGDLAGNLTLGTLLKMLLYSLPTLVMLTLPISLLIGALLGIGRLTVDSEIKAMRTHGVNLFRAFVPVFCLGGAATALMLANNLYFAPYLMNRNLRLIDMFILESINALEPGKFHDNLGFAGSSGVLYFKEKNPETGELKKVYICVEGGSTLFTNEEEAERKREKEEEKKKEEDKEARKAMVERALSAAAENNDAPTSATAEEAESATSEMVLRLAKAAAASMTTSTEPVNTLFLASSGYIETNEAQGHALLTLTSGTIHFIQDRYQEQYVALSFKSVRQRMQVDARKGLSSGNIRNRIPGLTFSDVNQEIARFKTDLDAEIALYPELLQKKKAPGKLRDIRYMMAEQYLRVTISFASFAFVLIAVPLAVYIRPSGKSVGISIAFFLIMAFYGFLYFGKHLVRNGWLALGPLIFLMPILLLMSFGAYLTYRVVRR